MRYTFAVTYAILIFANVVIAIESKKNISAFVPTKEWQTVKKGTPLPAGLHIRHNLQTGVTEAKLMDEEEEKPESNKSQENSLTIHPENYMPDERSDSSDKKESENDMKIPFDELKEMLKKMKADENHQQSSDNEQIKTERRRKFRSYEELKEELEALHMNVSTDSEVLTNLFSQFEPYKESISKETLETNMVEDILEILNNVEYLIHQIDNARMFTDMGGMTKIISPSLNSTNSDVKVEALKLLGAAVQSNPRVQLKALENDFIQKLLHLLTTNNKVEVKSRCLFALGALVRHFPAAQKALVDHGGLEIFGKILNDGQFQVQTRVMNLINDLAIERQNLEKIQDEVQRLKRTHEYNLANFEQKLISQEYCKHLIELMLQSLTMNSEIDDFYEVIYESMLTLTPYCKNEYLNRKIVLLGEIQKMLDKYKTWPKISEDGENLNDHHMDLLEKLRNIINYQHDEL